MASTSEKVSVKILTVGSAHGSIRNLFSKVRSIDAKHGKFDCVLCLGDFFGPLQEQGDSQNQIVELLNGSLEAPLRCYIMQGHNPLPESVIDQYARTGGQLCKDVFLLNKSGIVSTAHGLRIACLGGIYNPGIYDSSDGPPGFASPFYTTHTVERLLSNTMNKSLNTTAGQNYGSLAAIRDAASTSQLVDILLTNDWPASVTSHCSPPPSPPDYEHGSPPLDEIIRKIKPRYHFAARAGCPPKFWEREPFAWDDESGRVTRFVSLGAFGEEHSGQKQRWFYAFSIGPSAAATQRPTNTTKNPFVEAATRLPKRGHETAEGENFIFGNVHHTKRPRPEAPSGQTSKPPVGYKCKRCQSTEHFIDGCPERTKPPDGYLCKICNVPGHLVRDCPTKNAVGDTGGRKPREGYVCRACGSELHYIADCPVANQHGPHGQGGKRRPPKEIGPDECWFCLSNPNLAKHLIVSIGSECYLTFPKGQIIPTQSAPDESNVARVPGGGHVLIVPISHQPTYNMIPADISPPILDETERYKVALRRLFAKHGAVPVFYEVARLSAKGGHAHVQAVPVPISLQNKVEAAFLKEGRAVGIDFESDAEGALDACASSARSYFRVDLPDGRKLIHLMKDDVPFSVQFGRQVLVSLLSITHRLDWKSCILSEEEDRADVELFKKAFAPFDPSL
ncbi:CwfJ C-terminus 1-domain-containing protein-like protein [Boletus reticuloceps]|uniref:CwfJ C-terminus 1-domain-containing protein-like protein n=1 Tax=Boletus reticuloceps TaxID=495285 RepID=A0A8I2YQQ7_9AGAM|nr:CwfJ C-terminus 1-domain-containing protein-like protein [Boletus reticuloceps]